MLATPSSALIDRWERVITEIERRIKMNQIEAGFAASQGRNDAKAMYLANAIALRTEVEDLERRIQEARQGH